jgi:hypothetical protein
MMIVEPFAKLLCTIKRLVPGLLDFAMHLGRRKRIARKAEALAERASSDKEPNDDAIKNAA